jgi:predicted DNA-binding protein (UPF0251 family)
LLHSIGISARRQRAHSIGDYCDRGRTERRHVVATQVVHIGKEANKWEEQHFLGADEEAEIEYGVAESESLLDVKIRDLSDEIGERAAAEKIGISRTALRRALKLGTAEMSRSSRAQLARAAQSPTREDAPPKLAAELATCNQEQEAPTKSERLENRREPEDC